MEPRVVSAKYIFLDVVGFSRNRSVESQTEIIGALNQICIDSVKSMGPADQSIIWIPTGDGICIAYLDLVGLYDIHLLTALDILSRIDIQNAAKADSDDRRFLVRIGLNENDDNLVVDINGRPNVAGMGITVAQRTMGFADGGQILSSDTVFERIRYREKYRDAFRKYRGTGKHNLALNLYQYIGNGRGVNTDTPTIFQKPVSTSSKIPELVANYIVQAKFEEDFFKGTARTDLAFQDAATILIYLRACDVINAARNSGYEGLQSCISPEAGKSIREQFNYYRSLDYYVNRDFATLIRQTYLREFSEYFRIDGSYNSLYCVFVNDKALERVRQDWPRIGFDIEPT